MTTTGPDAAELSRLLGQWASGRATLPQELAAALAELIDTGLVPAGARLPPQRALATALVIARGTVTSAYDALEARGYVTNRQGAGARVCSARSHIRGRSSGRLFSFTSAPGAMLDLSKGALPASPVAAAILAAGPREELAGYLGTDGYFPAGLPVLRQAVADRYTDDGVPTRPEQIMITAGAQQATWLAVTALAGGGEPVLVEEPTYRGALEVLRAADAQVEGLPLSDGGLDVEHLRRALRRRKSLLYCQTAIHNPTGESMAASARKELAATINASGLVTIEDACSADLTLAGPPTARILAGLVDPDLLVSIGTASKLFWGGLRVGWIRAEERHIEAMVELRKPIDLACSVMDQVMVTELLRHTDTARRQRRAMLSEGLASTQEVVRELFPQWSWSPISGGSGLWIDTGDDAVALAEIGKRIGVRLSAGPSFSVYGGQRTQLRLPLWHTGDLLRDALTAVAHAHV
ncbi:aminotransferase-like domain-containing protein [Kribbella sp. NPDC055071]